MKIKDVYATYGREMSAYSDKIRTLTKQKRTLETEIKDDPGNADTLKKDYDRLELSIKSLEETRDKYAAFTEKIAEMEMNLHNALVAKQQAVWSQKIYLQMLLQ